jgi:hypothetical protein
MKTLVEFIFKLCFTWSFMLNVQGMNCFENKKINVSSQWGFDSWKFWFFNILHFL